MFLRRFGSLIWKQSREIEVLNFPKHIVYQIYTNQGYLYCVFHKDTQKVTVKNSMIEQNEDVPHLR